MVAALAGKRDQAQMGGHFPRIERKRLAVGCFCLADATTAMVCLPEQRPRCGAFRTGADECGGCFPRLGEALLTKQGSGYTKLSHRHATRPKYRLAPSSLLGDEVTLHAGCNRSPSPAVSILRVKPRPFHSQADERFAVPHTRQPGRTVAQRLARRISVVARFNHACPGRWHSEIHVLTFALAIVDDAEQPALLVEQRPTFRTRRDRRGELQQLAALAATESRDHAFSQTNAEAERIGKRVNP